MLEKAKPKNFAEMAGKIAEWQQPESKKQFSYSYHNFICERPERLWLIIPFLSQTAVDVTLGVVTFDGVSGEYNLCRQFTHLYAESHRRIKTLRLTELERQLDEDAALGTMAELAVVEYEQRRVGRSRRNRVKYIAEVDASAGYDIESITDNDSMTMPRYIEVKAVSPKTYRFFWSANEIAMSRALQALYFLYLVPIGSDGRPMMNELKTICDPAGHVLSTNSEWTVSPSSLRCEISES